MFTKHGLKLNLEKTEVLHIGHQREELDIELDVKKLTQRDILVYLGGTVCGYGKTEREVRRRVQAEANHLCHTGMPVRNGNLGTDRTTTTKAASVRKQLGPKNSNRNEGGVKGKLRENEGGVKGKDGSAE